MVKKQESGEGVYIAVGLLIMVVCVAGSILLHQNVVSVFLLGLFILLNGLVLIAILVGASSIFIYAFRKERGDDRTFIQIFKDEYSSNSLIENYKLFFSHLGEYLGESETYAKILKIRGAMMQIVSDGLRYVYIARKPKSELGDAQENSSESDNETNGIEITDNADHHDVTTELKH